MTDVQFDQLMVLGLCVGCVMAFGLGAIKGGQR